MGKFPVGKPKTGGRKKGTPNKVTSDLIKALEDLGINLPEGIITDLHKLARLERKYNRNPNMVFGLIRFRASVYLNLMQYVYPKRKPVDAKGNDSDGTLKIVVDASGLSEEEIESRTDRMIERLSRRKNVESRKD